MAPTGKGRRFKNKCVVGCVRRLLDFGEFFFIGDSTVLFY